MPMHRRAIDPYVSSLSAKSITNRYTHVRQALLIRDTQHEAGI